MLLKIFFLICLCLININIQPTTCAVPTDVQNLELDDITSIWDRFPSIIDKIKEAVSRFSCPKGWKRLGGSCYYLSNLTSISMDANYTCNYLHSNLSNLMQIQNAVELFYAVHVLSRNNFTSLMIDIDPNLLKGKKITDVLMNDQGLWQRMKEKIREVRIKYQKLKRKIVSRLNSTGLRILRRTKKVKQTVPSKKQFISDEIDPSQYEDYEFDDRESNLTNVISPNQTTVNISAIINNTDDEYEYDDLDSPDESDEFEQIEDIRGICSQIDWNVLNNNSTIFILTTYIVSEKTVCSLSDVEPYTEYHHVCEYVLDFCFANILCGTHGQCVNTLAGFECTCSFLYGGLLCEKISENGKQILISVGFIICLFLLSLKSVRCVLMYIVKLLVEQCKKHRTKNQQKGEGSSDGRQQLVQGNRPGNDGRITHIDNMQQSSKTSKPLQRRPTFAQEFMAFLRELYRRVTLPKTPNPLLSPVKRNFARNIWVGILSVFFLLLLFVITTVMHLKSFGYFTTDDNEIDFSINNTIYLVHQCEQISDYKRGNLIFAPFALSLILIFSWSIKREKACKTMCDGRPGLIPPIEPFRTANRFTTATVFGILAFEVLKIFEELLFSTGEPVHQPVLVELLERIAIVILVGLRYYPILASLQLRNIIARFFAFLYIICDITYTIIREGFCLGFLPLSGKYSAAEEAKLRMESGTRIIVYGLIKDTPHFFFLSYIAAELCVRFIYDSIYVPKKKKKSIWTSPVAQLDESDFAKYYVTKLFRRNPRSRQTTTQQYANIEGSLIDFEHEAEQQEKANQSRLKKMMDYIYHWDDDFRFTTIATCTYMVAFVFLYYLACTFIFLYISRTTGHVSFLKSYLESTYNLDLGEFSLETEIILSAVITVFIYGFQLFVGMQNYKKHKLELYQGIYENIPRSLDNFKPSTIASNSVHYSGFLVGYMAWGFVICFHLILAISIGIRILSLQIRHIELILAIIVPVLVIYLLKMTSMKSAGRFLFIQKLDDKKKKLNLQSRKTYAIFVYFSFFADCFIGIAACIIRLIKATFLNVVFMARLDCSFLGRPLEKFDLGFAAYASYLHMEVTYTNPIMLAFCYSLYDDIIQTRPKQCYDDECCIAEGELHGDEEEDETSRDNRPQQNRANLTQNSTSAHNSRRNNNNIPNKDESRSKRASQIETEQRVQEIMPKTQSPNLSIRSTNENQKITSRKTKQQQSNIVNEEKQTNASAIIQQRLSFGPPPEVPPRQDAPSEQSRSENDTDDDKSLKLKSMSTIAKIIPQQQSRLTSFAQSSRINRDDQTDEDEDDGASKQNILASEKGKQVSKAKKKKAQQKTFEDSDDNDDDVPKQQESLKQKKGNKGIPASNLLQDEDEDGGPIVKSYGTIKNYTPSKQLKIDNRTIKQAPSGDNTEDGTMRSSKYQQDTAPTLSDSTENTVPTEEEHATTTYSPPSYTSATNPTDLSLLRTISYRQAQQQTPPLLLHRSHIPFTSYNQNNTNDDSSHYSEITNDTPRSGFSNHSYSKPVLAPTSSTHSDKLKIIEKQQNEDTSVDIEEEDGDQENIQLLDIQPTSIPNQSAAISNVNITADQSEIEAEKEKKRIQRRKQLRFRWHFLYTILRNYHLFDLRKEVQGRLARLHLQRSTLIGEQQFLTTDIVEELQPVTPVPKRSFRGDGAFFSSTSEPIQLDIPTPVERRPPPVSRLLSVPASVVHDYPSSPAERYIAIRAQMIYDVNVQQPTTPYGINELQTPTIFNQQPRQPVTATVSQRSLGFPTSSDNSVHPLAVSGIQLKKNKVSQQPTSSVFQQESISPFLFQPASASNQSTTDYPLATPSIANSSIYRTQMSHDQHMQAWRQNKMEKIRKKQRHCYVYGPPPQPSLADKVSNAAILTPQIIIETTKQQQVPPTPSTGQYERQPTKPPFEFPLPRSQIPVTSSFIISDTQPKTNNQKSTINRQQQRIPVPPPRMDCLDEHPQETSNENKSSQKTSVLIHRKDSQSSVTDTTEV